MAQFLTLSRAARLVGVTRGALQRKIKDGEFETFEGMVSADDLLRAYPQTRLEDDALLERLTQLKDGAYGKRLRERILPSPEVLAVRLADIGRELAEARGELVRLRNVNAEFDSRLAALADRFGGEIGAVLRGLHDELRQQLTRAPEGVEHHPLVVRDSFMRVMVAHVHLLPSRHEFFVEGSDTLLESALRAGLALNYGCSNGNCGQCRARVVSGQVKKVRNYDYVLSEAEKANGTVLLCAHTAVTDLVIEAPEAGSGREIPLQQIATRVKTVQHLAPDLALLHLQTPRTRRLRFLAGQYVTLQAGDAAAVDYPVASCPCDDRNLQFHVHRMPDNPFADLVLDGLRPGDTVNVLGPRGEFALREATANTQLFIAWDTGFAPIKSLIEHAMALSEAETLHLYWLAAPGRGHYLSNLCRSWADALDNFYYTPVELPESAAEEPAQLQDILEQVVRDHPVLRDVEAYVAGAPALLEATRNVLVARGLPAEQLILGYPR